MYLSVTLSVCALIFSSVIETAFSSVLVAPCNPAILECGEQPNENFRAYSVSGINDLQLRHLDPLVLPKVSVIRKNSTIGPYEVYLKYYAVSGTRRYQILTNYANPDELLIKLKILFPSTKWSTEGLVNGEILGFPFNRELNAEVDIKNLELNFVLDGSEYLLLGRKYITWREGSVDVNQENIHVTLRDVPTENVELQAFNKQINSNIHLVEQHVHHLIIRTFGHFIIELINDIHKRYPVDILYP